VIFVDDYSSDGTLPVLYAFKQESGVKTHILKSNETKGPGICRNLGISHASGQYLIFLDSDDSLARNSLLEIHNFLSSIDDIPDIIPFDYCVTPSLDSSYIESHKDVLRSRNDFDYFSSKHLLIKSYLEMKMDGSVIFTAFRRDFIVGNKLYFYEGIYEDIAFLFKAFWMCNLSHALKKPIYFKLERPGSIVKTFSLMHVDRYISAWFEILRIFSNSASCPDHNMNIDQLFESFLIGIRGAIGVLLDMSSRIDSRDNSSHQDVIDAIIDKLLTEPKIAKALSSLDESTLNSKYDKIFKQVYYQLRNGYARM